MQKQKDSNRKRHAKESLRMCYDQSSKHVKNDQSAAYLSRIEEENEQGDNRAAHHFDVTNPKSWSQFGIETETLAKSNQMDFTTTTGDIVGKHCERMNSLFHKNWIVQEHDSIEKLAHEIKEEAKQKKGTKQSLKEKEIETTRVLEGNAAMTRKLILKETMLLESLQTIHNLFTETLKEAENNRDIATTSVNEELKMDIDQGNMSIR